MRICFVAPANNYHTQKWCNYFIGCGHDVHVISFQNGELPGVTLHWINSGAGVNESDVSKLKYLTKAREIKKIVDKICPDIVNVHYATSYGTAAALSGIKHYVLSVWGSDIYEFPKKSILHRLMLQFSLNSADRILSTSHAMAEEASLYTKKPMTITPFGVNMELFSPEKRTRAPSDGQFVVGTVKALTPTYGIDTLLKAVKLVTEKRSDIPLQVRIAGRGICDAEYKALAESLGIHTIIEWLGFIPQEQVAVEWANMDVCVVPSRAESFGVSAVEAQACGRPVIISDIPGLKEATRPGVSSIVIPVEAEDQLADAIVALYDAPEQRSKMGAAGRCFVVQEFELKRCFQHIEQCLFNE